MSGDTAWCWKIGYNEAHACASPGHPMIDHVWRERLALSDRLIALRPSRDAVRARLPIETLRRSAIATAKAARDRIRGR